MGMITRVRGRLRSFQLLSVKADPDSKKREEEKLAETICLLSVLFLLPYCSKGQSPLLLKFGGWFLISYSCLVLPLVVSANYKYPVKWMRQFILNIPGCVKYVSVPTVRFLKQMYRPVERCEQIFLKMNNLSTMATQLVFFMVCDRVLLCALAKSCPEKRTMALYSLMFYNVIAYCVSYIKELLEKENWSPYVNITQHSNIKHLAMSATKIVLEWTKAVTFIITVTFMLLVFGLEQGLKHYQPTFLYTIITWTYYLSTEKVFVELFLKLLHKLKISSFEAMENLFCPVLLRSYTLILACLLSLFLFSNNGQIRFTCIAIYLTIYLRGKDLYFHWTNLRKAQSTLDMFRQASKEEIENCDDVCAVCLSPMIRARVTPCQHLFHAECLRQCLNSSNVCPICKQEYTFII